jgi:hypothetical protein
MKKIVLAVVACLALSAQALASGDTQKASRQGRDDDGQNCLFSYQITKWAPSEVREHKDIVYKIRLDNLGSCDLKDVVVVDKLSRDVKFKEATPGFTLDDDKVIFKDLKIEENRSLHFFIRVETDTEHEVETVFNTAKAFSRQVGQEISVTVGTTVIKH